MQIFNSRTNTKNKIDYAFIASLYLLSFSIPLPIAIFNSALGLFLLVYVLKFHSKISTNPLAPFKNRNVLLLISFYLVIVVSLIYSNNKDLGLQILEKKIPILLFPILLSFVYIEKDVIDKMFLSFVISCTILCLYSAFKTLDVYFILNNRSNGLIPFDREVFSSAVNIFPTYYGMFVTFSVIILVNFIYHRKYFKTGYQKILLISFLGILIFCDVLISARMPLLILTLLGFAGFVRYALKKRKLLVIFFAIIVLVVISLVFNDDILIVNRFKEIVQTDWTPPVGIYHNSTNLRVGIFSCTYDILKEHWGLGLGVGDTQEQLNNCYEINGYSPELYLGAYNSHNEYLNLWLTAGIMGITFFISALVISIKSAFKSKNCLHLCFLTLFILGCMTESLLERQKGIIFYSFFNSLFVFSVISRKKENEDSHYS